MGSDATIATLTAWAEECSRSHSKCPSSPSLLPKRVLLIDNRTSPPTVRLHEPSNEKSRYICLSYCWGQVRPACLTYTSTLEANRLSIPWHTLPKMFQDAVMVITRLGLYHLWIDSMCIIQDDTQDWRAESAKMGSIYGNAFLTLCAASAHDSNEGLFVQRPRHSEPRPIAVRTDGSPVFIRRRHSHPYWNSDLSDQTQSEFPLLSRAWAYQESLLSSRVVY